VTSAGFGLYVRTVVDLRFSEVDKIWYVGERSADAAVLMPDLERTTAAQNTGVGVLGSK